jgi:DNA-binding CsgD family transcriptional regulator
MSHSTLDLAQHSHIDEIPSLCRFRGFPLGAWPLGCDDSHMAPAALLLPIPVDVAVGASFLAAGVVAWRLRPGNRTGLLMMLTGLAWFARDFARWDSAPPKRVGELSLNVFLALIAHQVIVFPYGVARSRLERWLIGAVYALALGGYALSEIFPSTNDPLAALAIPLIVLIVFVVVRRWLAATPPERRALEPILWAGPASLIIAAASIAHDYLEVGQSSAVDWLKLTYIAIPIAFLLGVLRTQLQRAAVGDLVVELSDVASAAGVRDALARTLGDPSLELAFWLPAKRRYVDLSGKPMNLPREAGRAVTEFEGVAALVYDPSLLGDPGLVRSAGAAARLALENARLQAELRSHLERRRDAEDGQLRADFLTAPSERHALTELTTRELEVLSLLAEGRTDRGIGQALYVSPKTVEAHVRSIFRKLDLPTDAMENRRVHAVLTFLRAHAL